MSAENLEGERDMIAVCDLTDDLRDTIVEYQVSTNPTKHMGWFTHAVCRLHSKRQSTSRTVD